MVDAGYSGKRHSNLFPVAALTLTAPCGSRPLLGVIIAAWRAGAAKCRKWRRLEIEDPTDEGPRPHLRTPGCAHVAQNCRGVSPPPFAQCGWTESGSGWQKHKRAPKWLRKEGGLSGPMYFYLPDDSLWMTMPNGLFMCVDEYDGLLADAASSFNSSLLLMCFSSWRCQASVTRQWRYKISLFGMSAADSTSASQDPYASAEECRFTSSDALMVTSFDDGT